MRKWLITFALAIILSGTGLAQDQTRRSDDQPQWVTPDVQARNTRRETFDSKLVGQQVSYLIYQPPTYASDLDQRFPVMYWLHGIGGGQQGVPAMVERFDDAIKKNKTPPMLVVFVNGLTASMYCDSADGKRPVESVIIKELVPHIDRTYRTIARREGRLIEGFSMGGFGATRLGFKYPDMFGAVSSLAGALHTGESLQQRHADLVTSLFANDAKKRDAAVPSSIAESNADALRDKLLIRLAVGDRDPTLRHNLDFDAHLTRLKIPHTYRTLPGVRHNPNELYESLGESTWEFYRQAFAPADGEANPK